MKKISLLFFLLALTTSILAAATKPQYITVGVHKYSILQAGSKQSTIIFFNGAGESFNTWTHVISRLDNAQRYFAYNRAGTDGSSPLVNQIAPRTAAGVVTRLRALLTMNKTKPPYILVAHSIGSLYALYFARAYPAEVKGIVLIEPSVDAMLALGNLNNLNKQQQAALNKLVQQINYNFLNEKQRFITYRGTIKRTPSPTETAKLALFLENLGKTTSQQEINKLPALKNIPLVVVMGADGTTQYDQIRRLAGKTLAKSVPNGKYEVIKNVGHDLQKDKPTTITAAIKKVL